MSHCEAWSFPELDQRVLQQVMDGSQAAVGILDTGLRYRYVNPALAEMNGVPPAEHIGRTVAEVLPDVDAGEDLMREVLADGRSREWTTSGQTRAASALERRYWHGAYHRLEDADGRPLGLVGIVLEVSASRLQQRDLERARARLALLDRAAKRIGTGLDMDTTCGELAEFLVPIFADVATVMVFPPEETDGLRLPPHGVVRMRRAAIAALPAMMGTWTKVFGPLGGYVDFPVGAAIPRCLKTGRPVVLNLVSDDEFGTAAPHPDRVRDYRAAGIHSALVVPLVARGESLGALTMTRTGDSPPFSDDDAVAAEALAGRAAISLDNARRFTREHGIALELQRALLSEPGPPHPGLEVASRYLPAGNSALVGGDWYDMVRLSYGRTLLAMGDVMGHGVEAAVDMSHYRSMLRVVAGSELPPHLILRRLDQLIAEDPASRPATCALALMDPARGVCSYASAGHLPPAILRHDATASILPVPTAPPLGTGHGGYKPVKLTCLPGEVLLLYTDGLIERRGEDIDVSLARLTGLRLRLPPRGDLGTLVDEILSRFVNRPAQDDVAVLASRLMRRSCAERPLTP
nr:SpoIIE family protein phosphatase [Actinacidiphila oryziradicis]